MVKLTGKNYNWHKAWRREGDRLVHISGAQFTIERGDGFNDINAALETIAEFQHHELARGVPVHDLSARLIHLAREAKDWLEFDLKN